MSSFPVSLAEPVLTITAPPITNGPTVRHEHPSVARTHYTVLMIISSYSSAALQISRVVTESGSSDKSKLTVGSGDLDLECLVARQQV